jgi:hypothetical protein
MAHAGEYYNSIKNLVMFMIRWIFFFFVCVYYFPLFRYEKTIRIKSLICKFLKKRQDTKKSEFASKRESKFLANKPNFKPKIKKEALVHEKSKKELESHPPDNMSFTTPVSSTPVTNKRILKNKYSLSLESLQSKRSGIRFSSFAEATGLKDLTNISSLTSSLSSLSNSESSSLSSSCSCSSSHSSRYSHSKSSYCIHSPGVQQGASPILSTPQKDYCKKHHIARKDSHYSNLNNQYPMYMKELIRNLRRRHTHTLLSSVSQRELYLLWRRYIGEEEELLAGEPTMDVEDVHGSNGIRERIQELKEMKKKNGKKFDTSLFLFSTPLLSGRRPYIHLRVY